jgi:hypothetical protein
MEKLRGAAGVAASTVLRVMIDPNAPAGSRLKAAEIVLDKAEVSKEFEHRLETIEAFLQLPSNSAPSAATKRSKPTPLLAPPAAGSQIVPATTDPAEDEENQTERQAS